jgi:glucose-1-phosphate thymidylyltransferase
MANVILFEDLQVESLRPIVLARPACGITCGAYRLIDWIAPWAEGMAYIVRPHLRAIVASDYAPPSGLGGRQGATLLVNAALVPSLDVIERLKKLAADNRPCIVRVDGRVAAAVVRDDQAPEPRQMTYEGFNRYLVTLALDPVDVDLPLLHFPHEVIRWHLKIMRANLEHRIAQGSYRQMSDGLFVAEGVELGQYLVTDVSRGPIVIESGARIGPFGFMTGPVHIGKNARVIEHSAIKDAVVLGHTTKVGGEVEASIIEPYTNKQHHGFLGHSYLGSWINLGAGTSNSDLKNTYGEVNLEIEGKKVATGMQFVGCTMGDYAKSAVNTSIFTGKSVGVGSLLYGFVTTNVPSFVNYARSFGQVTEAPVEVLVATQARMFARRNVTQRVCDIQLLHDMFDLTRPERQLAGEPLAL